MTTTTMITPWMTVENAGSTAEEEQVGANQPQDEYRR